MNEQRKSYYLEVGVSEEEIEVFDSWHHAGRQYLS